MKVNEKPPKNIYDVKKPNEIIEVSQGILLSIAYSNLFDLKHLGQVKYNSICYSYNL